MSSKDLALQLDEELDKDCLTKRNRRRMYPSLKEVYKNFDNTLKRIKNNRSSSKSKRLKTILKFSINP